MSTALINLKYIIEQYKTVLGISILFQQTTYIIIYVIYYDGYEFTRRNL